MSEGRWRRRGAALAGEAEVKIGIEWRAWNGVVTYLEAFYEVIRMDGVQRGWDLWVGQTDDWPSVF